MRINYDVQLKIESISLKTKKGRGGGGSGGVSSSRKREGVIYDSPPLALSSSAISEDNPSSPRQPWGISSSPRPSPPSSPTPFGISPSPRESPRVSPKPPPSPSSPFQPSPFISSPLFPSSHAPPSLVFSLFIEGQPISHSSPFLLSPSPADPLSFSLSLSLVLDGVVGEKGKVLLVISKTKEGLKDEGTPPPSEKNELFSLDLPSSASSNPLSSSLGISCSSPRSPRATPTSPRSPRPTSPRGGSVPAIHDDLIFLGQVEVLWENVKGNPEKMSNCSLRKRNTKEIISGSVTYSLSASRRVLTVTAPVESQKSPKEDGSGTPELVPSPKGKQTPRNVGQQTPRNVGQGAKKAPFNLKFWPRNPLNSRRTPRKRLNTTEIIFQCLQFLSHPDALRTEGIFRVSAPHPEIAMLRELCEGGHELTWDCGGTYGTSNGVHTVGGVVMAILLEMEEPLIPFVFYDDLIATESDIPDLPSRLSFFKNILKLLDLDRRIVFERLCRLLSSLSETPSNRMTTDNLAIVFNPVV